MNAFMQLLVSALSRGDFQGQNMVKVGRDDAREFISSEMRKRLLNIQVQQVSTKQATLETSILLQSRDMLAVTYRIFNLYRKYLKSS